MYGLSGVQVGRCVSKGYNEMRAGKWAQCIRDAIKAHKEVILFLLTYGIVLMASFIFAIWRCTNYSTTSIIGNLMTLPV